MSKLTNAGTGRVMPPNGGSPSPSSAAFTAPKLWSVDDPVLYPVRIVAGHDEVTMRVGFRTIRFDADRGFFLNDQPLKIKGTCEHQGHVGVGELVPADLPALSCTVHAIPTISPDS